jgi:hypothetical protein
MAPPTVTSQLPPLDSLGTPPTPPPADESLPNVPPTPPTLVPDSEDAFGSSTPAPVASDAAAPAPPSLQIDEWDSSFGDEWSEEASVFEGDNAPPEPEENFDEVGWERGQQAPAMIPQLPTKGALNKMKKADLVELAEGRGVDSEGKKDDIIERLLA